MAATSESDQHILHSLHLDAQIPFLARDDPEETPQSPFGLLFPRLELFRRHQLGEHLARRDLAIAYARQEGLLVLHPEFLGNGIDPSLAPEGRIIHLVTGEVSFEDLPSQGDTPFPLLGFEPVADL